MKLPDQYRHRFKEPMGELIPEADMDKGLICGIVSGARTVTVGDRTTEKILAYGIVPDIQIVDGMERRERRTPPNGASHTIHCTNPPAHITEDAIGAIITAYGEGQPVRILVSGEEDLLLIPALMYAPDGVVLMYGQPEKGLVVVRANGHTREMARQLMTMLEG